MKRRIVITLLVLVLVAAVGWWTANNTHWDEITIPMPLKGEALRNPFYAAQRLSESLGARTAWDRTFTAPAPDGVIVLSGWHWTLSARRRESLERWVEAGGRLVVAGDLAGGEAEFAGWSGIVRTNRKLEKVIRRSGLQRERARVHADPFRRTEVYRDPLQRTRAAVCCAM